MGACLAAWVYILECSDGKYYVGSHRGDDPETRVAQHNDGFDPDAWTYSRRPVKLVWCEEFQRITDAIECEQRIKRWSRAKKEAMMRGDWAGVKKLARGTPLPSKKVT